MYPGGPPRRPYDVTAHTLPLLMGVDVQYVEHAPAGGAGAGFGGGNSPDPSLAAADTDAWFEVNRIWAAGGRGLAGYEDRRFRPRPAHRLGQYARPRVGLYHSFVPNSDEGWTRWLLDHFGFAYRSVTNPVVQAGSLRRDFDVLVFPDQRPPVMERGFAPGAMPDEFTGGLGEQGAEALRRFAAEGGTLVFLNSATGYALAHLGIPAEDVVRGAGSSEFYSPGSLLNVKLDSAQPLALGLPAEIAIWSEHSPAWQTRGTVVARYPDANLLASGWLLGEKYIAGRAALVEARVGPGRVVLFGMQPQFRAQSYQAFKLFFNALLDY